jgi:hypothetical protein
MIASSGRGGIDGRHIGTAIWRGGAAKPQVAYERTAVCILWAEGSVIGSFCTERRILASNDILYPPRSRAATPTPLFFCIFRFLLWSVHSNHKHLTFCEEPSQRLSSLALFAQRSKCIWDVTDERAISPAGLFEGQRLLGPLQALWN